MPDPVATLAARIEEAIETIKGDVYLRHIGEITRQDLDAALKESFDSIRAALAELKERAEKLEAELADWKLIRDRAVAAEARIAQLEAALERLREKLNARPDDSAERNTYGDGFTSGLIYAITILDWATAALSSPETG